MAVGNRENLPAKGRNEAAVFGNPRDRQKVACWRQGRTLQAVAGAWLAACFR